MAEYLTNELIDLLGEANFIRLVEAYGGQGWYIAGDIERSEMTARLGEEIMKVLAYYYGGTTLKVPIGRAVLARHYRRQGLSNREIDGIVGRATLSALQRELEARSRTKATAGAGVGGSVAGVGDEVTGLVDGWASLAGAGVVVVAIGFGLWLSWHYRDVLAARVNPYLPKLAKFLWSF